MPTVLELQNLDISFPVDIYHSSSAKDIFVQALCSPYLFFKKPNVKPVLRNINLKIQRGDRVAIIGVNGGGKTTLCRCITGTLKPDRGTVLSSAKTQAFIQAETGFFAELTGRENALLLSHFLYADLNHKDRLSLVEDALNFCDLGKYVDAPLTTYSLGMKSRLTLSLLTARPCELLILDEVYNHSDEFFRSRIEHRLHKQIRESDTVVMVSHYEKDLIQFCNRGIVIHEGNIEYDGSMEKALKVYRFLNRHLSMNTTEALHV